MKTFISHIAEDEKLAFVLKEWIEKSFLGQVEIFVSSDPNDILIGDQWFKEIEGFLSESDLVIVLITKLSVNRRWINFEAGAGWIKNIPVIPICFSGLTKSTLPQPLSFLQSVNLNDPKFSEILLNSIAKHLKFPKTPNIDYEAMNKELLQSIGEYFEDEELGLLDHTDFMENGIKEIGEIFKSITDDMLNLQLESRKLTEKINHEKLQPSQGTTRFLQKLSKKYSEKVDSFTEKISSSNDSYINIINRIEKNIKFVFSYTSPQTNQDVNEIQNAIISINRAIVQGDQTQQQFIKLNNIIESMPKFEKHLNRSLDNYRQQLTIFTDNLETFLDVLRKAEVDGKNLINQL